MFLKTGAMKHSNIAKWTGVSFGSTTLVLQMSIEGTFIFIAAIALGAGKRLLVFSGTQSSEFS